MKKELALVVLSGGQDSITCLGVALKEYEQVEAITFDYGQRHRDAELAAAEAVCKKYGVKQTVVVLGDALSSLAPSALTDATANDQGTSQPHPLYPDLPASFVPGRNAMFLTLAYAKAVGIGAKAIITGVCQTDYSGYPDCRRHFIDSLQTALISGYTIPIRIETPLMWINKAATFELAEKVGILDDIIELSRTCYNGSDQMNEWGHGCGECPACKVRAEGWRQFLHLTGKDKVAGSEPTTAESQQPKP